MTTIINNFRVSEPFCLMHAQHCQFIYLEENKAKLVCRKCLNLYQATHAQSGNKIIPTDQFRQYISGVVSHQAAKLAQCAVPNIKKIIEDKKKQIEQKQYQILDSIIKRLSSEKQILFEELAVIERHYMGQQLSIQANIEQRQQIIKYLQQFCVDELLLKLKIMTSSQFGLTSFVAQLKSLQVHNGDVINRNAQTIINQVTKQIRNKQENLLIGKLESLLCNSEDECSITSLKLAFPKAKCYYNNQVTERRNQSQQNISLKSPRTSRQHSYAQLPKLILN